MNYPKNNHSIAPTITQSHFSQTEPSSESPSPSSVSRASSFTVKEDWQTQKWVAEVLYRYLTKYVRDFIAEREDIVPSPVTSWIILDNSNGSGEGGVVGGPSVSADGHDDNGMNVDENRDSTEQKNDGNVDSALKPDVDIANLIIIEETALGDDRITYLSRILSVTVAYTYGGMPDSEQNVHWLVKLPSRQFDERNLARVTSVHRREAHFYTIVLQDIKHWLEANMTSSNSQCQSLVLNIPSCYYAHSQGSPNYDVNIQSNQLPNPECTIVLDDLRAQGFGKRHFGIGLSKLEATEAFREIAKFHAVCWVMRQGETDRALMQKWPWLMEWEDLYEFYLDTVRLGFRHLQHFTRDMIGSRTYMKELADWILSLESHLPKLLQKLLQPLPPPSVTSLIHMDLWTDNLLFRETHDDSAKVNHTTDENTAPLATEPGSSDEGERPVSPMNKELDCMILDWQMVTIGRISHDLGILMVTSLDCGVRRNYWQHLLQCYCDTFEEVAERFKMTVPFSFDQLITEYKQSCLLAVLLVIGRMELVIAEESTLLRFFDVLEDLKNDDYYDF